MEAEDTGLLWSSAPEEDERQHQESNQEDDFCPGEPKLCLAVEADGHEIQTDYHDEHDSDPDCDVNAVGPVVDDQAGSGDFVDLLMPRKQEGCWERTFVGDQNAKSVPVQISHRKTHTS